MSFYHLALGQHHEATKLLALLRTAGACEPARYRDCYFDGTHIVVHTRTGGGNREEYEAENDAMADHPWFVRDEDEEFDCTYANFYYAPPAAIAVTLQRADATPAERWEQLLQVLKG